MKHYPKIIVLSTLLTYSSMGVSAEDNCPVSVDALYSKFREYRLLLNKEHARHEQLAKYYQESKSQKYVEKIKSSEDKQTFYRNLNAFEFDLEAGRNVRVVYGYSIECSNPKNVKLLLNAFTYISLTQYKRKNKDPSKVTINYVKENGDWKIVSYVVDSRKSKTGHLPTSVIIDDFR